MIGLSPFHAGVLVLGTLVIVYYLGQQVQSKSGKVALWVVGFGMLTYILWNF